MLQGTATDAHLCMVFHPLDLKTMGRDSVGSNTADRAMPVTEAVWGAKPAIMLSQIYKSCSDTRVRLVFSLALANSQDACVRLEKRPRAVGPLAHSAWSPPAAPCKAKPATLTAAATAQAAIPAVMLQQSAAAARTGRPQRAAAAMAAAAIAAGALGGSQGPDLVQGSGRAADSSFELWPSSSEGRRPLETAPGAPMHTNIMTARLQPDPVQRPGLEQQKQQPQQPQQQHLAEAAAMHQKDQAATARKGRKRFRLVAPSVKPGLNVGPETPATAAPTAADAGKTAAPPASTGRRAAGSAAAAGKLRPPSLVIRTTAAAARSSSALAVGSPTLAARTPSAHSLSGGASASPRSSAFGQPRVSAGRLDVSSSAQRLASEGQHEAAATASPVSRSRAASQVDGWSSAWGPHASGTGRPLAFCPPHQSQLGAAQSPRSISRKPAARHVLDRVLSATSQAPAVKEAVREAAAARVIKEAAAAREAAAAAAQLQRREAAPRMGAQGPCMPNQLPAPADAALQLGASLSPDGSGRRPGYHTPSSPTTAGRRDAASPTAQLRPLGQGQPDSEHSLGRNRSLEGAAQQQPLERRRSSEDRSSKRRQASVDAAQEPYVDARSLEQRKCSSNDAAVQRPLEREPSAFDRGLKRQRHSSEGAAPQRPHGQKPCAGKDSLMRQQRSSEHAAQQFSKRQRSADKRRLKRQQLSSADVAQPQTVELEPPAGDGRLTPQQQVLEGAARQRPVEGEPSADARSLKQQRLSSGGVAQQHPVLEGAALERPVKREPPGEERTLGRCRSSDGDRGGHGRLPSPVSQQRRRQRPRQRRPRSESQQPPWRHQWQEWQPPQVRLSPILGCAPSCIFLLDQPSIAHTLTS